MDFSKLKKTLRDDLSAIYERAQFIEKQTAARDAAVDRLTRAEAIATAASLHDLLGWTGDSGGNGTPDGGDGDFHQRQHNR